MSASADTIERIRKLLRLARSSNPHEAELALARALELAREHDVSIEGLNPDEQAKERKVTHHDMSIEARLTYDKRYAWAICRSFFNVSSVEVGCIRMVDGWPCHGVKMMVVGTEADISIALWVYDFLIRHFSFCWRHYRGRLRNRHAYVHGMFLGIHSKLQEKNPSATVERAHAIVLQERKSYIAAVIGKTEPKMMGAPDGDARAATWAGYARGRNTNIAMPIHGSASEPLALR